MFLLDVAEAFRKQITSRELDITIRYSVIRKLTICPTNTIPNFAAARRREKARNIEVRVPHWWNKEVRAKAAIACLSNCHALYFDKHWHTWSHAAAGLAGQATR